MKIIFLFISTIFILNVSGQDQPYVMNKVFNDSLGKFVRGFIKVDWENEYMSVSFDSLHRINNLSITKSGKRFNTRFEYVKDGYWEYRDIYTENEDSTVINHIVSFNNSIVIEGNSSFNNVSHTGRTRIGKWKQYKIESNEVIGFVIFTTKTKNEKDCPQSFDCTFIEKKFGNLDKILNKNWW